jgi:hypothetical protein
MKNSITAIPAIDGAHDFNFLRIYTNKRDELRYYAIGERQSKVIPFLVFVTEERSSIGLSFTSNQVKFTAKNPLGNYTYATSCITNFLQYAEKMKAEHAQLNDRASKVSCFVTIKDNHASFDLAYSNSNQKTSLTDDKENLMLKKLWKDAEFEKFLAQCALFIKRAFPFPKVPA